MRILTNSAALVASMFISIAPAMADVKLPAVISNNMMLQAEKPLPIWGWADAGEKVKVAFGDQQAETVAGNNGEWKVTLKPVKSGNAGDLTVTGKNTIVVTNVLAGTVWICSGQSNMEWSLNNSDGAAAEIPKATYPKIRLFTVAKKTSLTPERDVKGAWVECSPGSAPGFSAVGYYFGREIHQKTGNPVGLIHTSWGGTPAEAWTSKEGLAKDATLKGYSDALEAVIKGLPHAKEKYEKDLAAYKIEKAKWDQEVGIPFAEEMKQYEADVKKAKAELTPEPGKPIISRKAPVTPTPPGASGISAAVPSSLYNGMIAPIVPYAIEGAIWYQGEANAGAADLYRSLFPRMITDWREHWAQGDFPFYFVQLANFLQRANTPVDEAWAQLRESQFLTLSLPNTGMAVAIDIGNAADIHPRNKLDVGLRLARWALRDIFGRKIVPSGPLFSGMKIEGEKIRLSFIHVGSGLMIGRDPEKPETELTGFAIAGEDGKFVWAKAVIDGESVVVSGENISKPTQVRYAWANNPACNLYNKDGLPASPFRTNPPSTKK